MTPRGARQSGRIVVLGYVIRAPIGGLAWHPIQYVLGLDRMGYDVLFVEDSGYEFLPCYDPITFQMTNDPSFGLAWASESFGALGLSDRWCYYDAGSASWLGPAAAHASAFCASADLVLNVSGVNPLREWISTPTKVFIDTDPAFQQARAAHEREWADYIAAHDRQFTFGECIAAGTSRLPDDGINWQSTRQPLVMDVWPTVEAERDAPFTTIMQWESYASRRIAGIDLGLKAQSFEAVMNVPARVDARLEVALGGNSAPRERLARNGWHVADPTMISRTLFSYQHYLQQSRGEFSVAKQGYVAARTGWFSERTVNYLASGRPVVVEDTGFSSWLEAGRGVLTFTDADGAVAALLDVIDRYEWHASVARDIAREHFESTRVLCSLLDRCR